MSGEGVEKSKKTKTHDIRITNADIKMFQSIYLKYYGLEIGKDEARDELIQLTRSLQVIYNPISLEQLERYSERKQRGLDEES